MKNMKKLGALLLVLVLMLSLSANAFADVTIGNGGNSTATGGATEDGVIGGYVEADKQAVDDKVIILKKEIKAFNPDEIYVYGPSIEYSYAITAASGEELKDVTDATTDHLSNTAITKTTLAGANPGSVRINKTAATDDDKIVWANTDILDANTTGAINTKTIAFDFTNVVFSAPGVYRYKITETVIYTGTGVTEKSDHVRYLDVYVMPGTTADAAATNYTDGTTAAQWRIYGYVCFENTPANIDAATASTLTCKTNGFVGAEADEYYTYNLTVTKDLVNDGMMIDHQFPFAVSFSNTLSGTFQLIVESDGTKSDVGGTGLTGVTNVAAGAATVNEPNAPTTGTGTTAAIKKIGNAQVLSAASYTFKLADGNATIGTTTGYVKLIGIPNTEVATVTETNDNTGVIYTASVKEDDTTNNAGALTAVDMSSTTNSTGVVGTPKVANIATSETASRIANTGNTADALGKNIDIQFTNNLAIISPTGVVIRIAPYALMLGFGIMILAVSRRRREEEEEPALA